MTHSLGKQGIDERKDHGLKADVIVIGAGAAGLMAAGRAGELGAQVLLVERNQKNGRKLLITGKGRCNITNDCDMADFIKNVPGNGKFLFGCFERFTNRDLLHLLEQNGLQTKVERGGRIFPVSDHAADVLSALEKYALTNRVKRIVGRAKELLLDAGRVCGVKLENGTVLSAPNVIVATGGASYPQTGSTGDGYTLASQAGHTIVEIKPSLVPLETEETWCAEAMGLSLKNVTLRVRDRNGKVIYQDFGEMMLAHFGVSGPIVISASAHMKNEKKAPYRLELDLKPALDAAVLDKRLLRDFEENKNKDFCNSLDGLFPKKLIPVMIKLSGISPRKKVNEITRQERMRFAELIKCLPLTVKRARPIAEAIVTSGGVRTGEINPKTMESKLLGGLYFAGEVIDVDAYTGGFNLQIAFSTGWCAGEAAVK